MAQLFEPVSKPIPISLVSGRYLIYDIDVVTYLRRTHHICGVLIGGIVQAPQQNVFSGLPLELIPEEVKLLVNKEVAYIVDDVAWHKDRYSTLYGEDKKKYLESLRAEGLKASNAAASSARKKTEQALAKHAVLRASRRPASSARDPNEEQTALLPEARAAGTQSILEESLFERPASPVFSISSKVSETNRPFAITPTTSYSPSSLPQNSSQQVDPTVPPSYALFAYLHSRDYYMMPGLRFGCNYNVYPGDPLRFHSHFLATSYEWNQDIDMLDLIGGGRLGTAVKKGFLIGGEDTDSETDGHVRSFAIEWAGM